MDNYIKLNGSWSSSVSLYSQKSHDYKTHKPITLHYINISSPHCCGGFQDSTSARITLEEAKKLLTVLPSLIEALEQKSTPQH